MNYTDEQLKAVAEALGFRLERAHVRPPKFWENSYLATNQWVIWEDVANWLHSPEIIEPGMEKLLNELGGIDLSPCLLYDESIVFQVSKTSILERPMEGNFFPCDEILQRLDKKVYGAGPTAHAAVLAALVKVVGE